MRAIHLRCMALCSFLVVAASVARSAEKPDIFLITIDTIRADHIGCYGDTHIKTPAFDALAHDGYQFQNAFTASPITNASHASILTGQYPSVHGVTDFGVPLLPSHVTIAEVLKGANYDTAAFIGAVILDSRQLAPGFDRGFDFYDNFPANPNSKSRWNRLERRGEEVEKRTEAWLLPNTAGPRFVWMHLYDPHDPYEPPPPYSDQYRDRPYDGEIAYTDHVLGQFIRFLKAHNLYYSSLIIVVGDHGEGLNQHSEATHGMFLYDTTIHVPLIIKLPSTRNAAKLVQQEVRTVDIFPTILELASVHPVSELALNGASLVPYFSGSTVSRSALAETDYPLRFGAAPLRAMRDMDFKYIEAPRPELYNLRSDPSELHNVYAPWHPAVQDLRAELAKHKTNRHPEAPVSNGTIAELRALGYLGNQPGETTVPEPSMLPDPKDAIQLQNLLHAAMMSAEEGDTANARATLLNAAAIAPNSPAVLSELGQVELAAGDYGKALHYFQQAIKLRPDDPESYAKKGEALTKIGDMPGARDAFEASLKLAPGEFSVRRELAKVYLALGDQNKAADQLEAAVFQAPEDSAIRVEFAQVLLSRKEFSKAAEQLEIATRATPSIDSLELLRHAYLHMGEAAQAQRTRIRETKLDSHKSATGHAH